MSSVHSKDWADSKISESNKYYPYSIKFEAEK